MFGPAALWDVIVVGGGAAGLATAIFSRERSPHYSVLVLDGARRVGAKILVSGGGRCNVTNAVVTERDYWGGQSTIVRKILRALPVGRTVAFFERSGVMLHEEEGGKLFPVTNRARDVLDALLRRIESSGATLRESERVTRIVRTVGGFEVATERSRFAARAVVLATGGCSIPRSGSDGYGYGLARELGHSMVPTTPALAPLRLGESSTVHARLSGVSLEAELALWVAGALAIHLRGPLLWTHFGVSGPVALNLSRHWARARLDGHDAAVTANFAPGRSFHEIEASLIDESVSRPRSTAGSTLARLVPASMASVLLDAIGVDGATPLSRLSRDDRRRLTRAATEWPLPVVDTRGYNFAEVTAGGVSLREIDPATMESRVCPGLYLVGEILDVDGRLGGFNFQWAWSSAYVASRGLAARA
jgi:predicted Rossmann fold flavoprotein